MDYHHLYNTSCSRYNQFSATFPPNYGIPQGFARHVGLEGHVYDTRQVVRQNVTYDYVPYSQMWNIPPLQTNSSSSDSLPYTNRDTVLSSQITLDVTEQKPTFNQTGFHETLVEDDNDLEERKGSIVNGFGLDAQLEESLTKSNSGKFCTNFTS